MNNNINPQITYVTKLSAEDSTAVKPRDIAVIESELKAYVASFDAMRTSYIADLERLREVYRPAFKSLLQLINEKKKELEETTGKGVELDE